MMLASLKKAWQSGSIMNDVLEHLAQMVADAEIVAAKSWEVCAGRLDLDEMKPLIRKRDKEINRGERTVRRLIVQHLNLNPGTDVSGCIAVLLMAKDIERIGDHGWNVFQVSEMLPGRIPQFRFYEQLDRLQVQIAVLLGLLHRAVADSDSKIAHRILDDYQVLKREVKQFRNSLFPADLSCDEAVATTLLVRYSRRMIAHVGNAASGIIFPVESIDFISRGLKEEMKDR